MDRGRWRPLLFAAMFLASVAVHPAAGQFPFSVSYRFELSGPIDMPEINSVARTHLENAKAFVAIGQWDDAIETLRQVMETHGAFLISVSDRRYINLRDYCHLQLTTFPPDALERYRGLVDPQARRWYEAGLADRSELSLRRVIDQAFCSHYGDDALLALGELALEAGNYGQARGAWERILETPALAVSAGAWQAMLADPGLSDADRALLETWYTARTIDGDTWHELHRVPAAAPAEALRLAELRQKYRLPQSFLEYPGTDIPRADVLARLVLVSILEGSPERAERELASFAAIYPDAEGRLGGRTVRYAEALTQLLADSHTWLQPEPSNDWPTFAGSPDRSRLPAMRLDVGGVAWRQPLPEAPSTDFGYPPRRVAEGSNPLRPGGQQGLLSYHPVVVGNLVLVNTMFDIRAYNLETGEPAWNNNPVVHTDRDAELDARRQSRNVLGAPRFTMTVHGSRLFVRMGNYVTSSANDLALQSRPGYLVCLDLSSEGLLLWKIDPPEAGWAFEGAPVCDGTRIYVGLRRSDVRPQAHVACYDSETGRLLWRQFVCSGLTPGQGQVDECTHNLLTLHGGMIYYNTNLGAVAALDCHDGRIQWLTLYPRAQSGDLTQRATHFFRDLTPCVHDRGRLFVAPADSTRILGIDAPTGMLLWETTQPEDAIHLLGVGADALVASGDRLWWIDADSGKILHYWPDGAAPKGYGRGTLGDGEVYWPTREEVQQIRVFDQATGRQVRDPILLDPRSAPVGNLVLAGDFLLIATENELVALRQRSSRRGAEVALESESEVPMAIAAEASAATSASASAPTKTAP